MQALHRYLNPLDVFSAYQRFSFYDILTGMHPFQLINSKTRKNPLRMVLSPSGLIFSCVHMLAFGLSSGVVLVMTPKPVTIFKDNALANVQQTILEWVQCLNTLIIFLFTYVRNDRDLLLISRLQVVDAHVEALGYDMVRFYRNSVLGMLFALILILILLVGLFVHGMYFYWRFLEDELVFLFGIATVMPAVYIQVLFVQFIILMAFNTIRMRQLNNVMLKVLKQEGGIVD